MNATGKLSILLFCVIFAAGCRPTKTVPSDPLPLTEPETAVIPDASEHVWDFRDATTWILGDFSRDRLYLEPHSSWFIKEYDDYAPDNNIMKEFSGIDREGLTITIVLGTWCPDSRREVPRFMKITDLWGFPSSAVRFIGVDINKAAPLDDYQTLNIERVPTFIFYKNNIEAGRIIEVPVSSLEQDMIGILRRESE